MKSYFLEAVVDRVAARAELTELLPGQTEPWLLPTADGSDTIAYFNVFEADDGSGCQGPNFVMADISGRHFHEDRKIIDVLHVLQGRIGGVVRDDRDNDL